ncbi:MAG TPA: response regulator, partial [Candidatus Xenobia bacterium]
MSARVLLVEDNAAIVKLVGDLLTVSGYEVSATCDADTVLRTVRDWRPAVVLMDVNLPGSTNGLALTRAIKRLDESPSILVFTASALPEDEERAMAAGADGFLSKPIRMADLLARIRSYLPPPPRAVDLPDDTLRPETASHPFGEQPPGPTLARPTSGADGPLERLVNRANLFDMAATQELAERLAHWPGESSASTCEATFRILSRLEPAALRCKAAEALARERHGRQTMGRFLEASAVPARCLALEAMALDLRHLPFLWDALEDHEPSIRQAAAVALGRLARSQPELQRRLVTQRVLPGLMLFCDARSDAREVILAASQSGEVETRMTTLKALLEADPWPALALDVGRDRLRDECRDVQGLAVALLVRAAQDQDQGDAVACLLGCARDARHPARLRALRGLMEAATTNQAAQTAVQHLLPDLDEHGRMALTLGLSPAMQRNLPVGVRLLVDVSAGSSLEVRAGAAQAVVEAAAACPTGSLTVLHELFVHRDGWRLLPFVAERGGECGKRAARLWRLAQATEEECVARLADWRMEGGDQEAYGLLEKLTQVAAMDDLLVAAADIGLLSPASPAYLRPALQG